MGAVGHTDIEEGHVVGVRIVHVRAIGTSGLPHDHALVPRRGLPKDRAVGGDEMGHAEA